jgi:hypothetical protein
MSREQHDDVQSFRVVNPDPEMPVLLTPDQFRSESGRLMIPTPPTSERHLYDGHLSDLRRRRASGQVVDSDGDRRCEGQGSMTAPVASGRRRMAATFPTKEHGATGGSVSNDKLCPL